MPSDWVSFHCPGSGGRWRYLDGGLVEIDGEGTPAREWPEGVNKYRAEIEAAAARHELQPNWVAAIMALETRGHSVCLRRGGGLCYGQSENKGPGKTYGQGCDCVSNEGGGVMAMLAGTAKQMAGRPVTTAELMGDPALAIDLGAKYLRNRMDAGGGDFVKGAVGYNAGSVRCGTGRTFKPEGEDIPREPCPSTGWGIVMGCAYTDWGKGIYRCAPSKTGYKPYVCSNDYPRTAVKFNNAAVQDWRGIKPEVPPTMPPVVPPAISAGAGGGAHALALIFGVAVGYQAVKHLRS